MKEKTSKKVIVAIRQYVHKFLDAVKEWFSSVVNWIKNNPQLSLLIGYLAVRVFEQVSHTARQHSAQKFEERMRNRSACTIYDPHTGLHFTIRREMTAQESDDFEKLTKAGYSYSEAIMKMGLAA